MTEIRACQSLSESRERENRNSNKGLCELKNKPYGPVWDDRTWVSIVVAKLNTLCTLDPPALASEVLDSQ